MDFILFVLSFVLNPIIIAFIPNDITQDFLKYFSFGNLIFSLFFTISFSYKKAIEKVNYLLVSIILIAIISIFIFKNNSIFFFYPFFLLAADYTVTQKKIKYFNLIYRIFLILSVFLLFLFHDFFLNFIVIRSLFCLLVVTMIILNRNYFKTLNLGSPFKMIFITYTFYSGTLALLPYLFDQKDSIHLKVWYLTFQISLGLILKQLDFSTRANFKIELKTLKLINLSLIFSPFFTISYLVITNKNSFGINIIFILVLYYVSLFFLKNLNKTISVKKINC